jgi:hypothetical protein
MQDEQEIIVLVGRKIWGRKIGWEIFSTPHFSIKIGSLFMGQGDRPEIGEDQVRALTSCPLLR